MISVVTIRSSIFGDSVNHPIKIIVLMSLRGRGSLEPVMTLDGSACWVPRINREAENQASEE
jgi:hypothetical protein